MAKKRKAAAETAEPRETTGAGKDEKTKPSWRSGLDFVVMVGGAVLIALLIKAYLFDVYLIPSGSMETAFHGRPDGGDRIFCSKLNYHLRDLKRWEVAVFEFPYESARRTDASIQSGELEVYRGQNFVKRVVGLPDETLAIARGDIWVRRSGSGADYRREVKPDAVQRGMWLNVYEEDFGDLLPPELEVFWKILGGDATLAKGGPLVLSPGDGEVRMDYRPRTPAGIDRRVMVELPGVPDRYTLRQPVQFKCGNPGESGEPCGRLFVKTTWTHNMQARCPACGNLLDESSVVFYHRRSGLPIDGRYAADPDLAPQGEEVSNRYVDYHIVPDLRVVADVALGKSESRLSLTLREDSRFVQAVFTGDGRIEILVNGQPSTAQQRAVADIRPGRSHRVEFYIVEGTARVFVDSTETALLDLPIWNDRRPFPKNLVSSSGVSVGAAGGDVEIRKLAIDRDVFYYSSWERDRGIKFNGMNTQGEVFINSESFFPMGDHCPSSFDARSWGPVPLSLLRGPALFIWWPPDRIGPIPSP